MNEISQEEKIKEKKIINSIWWRHRLLVANVNLRVR